MAIDGIGRGGGPGQSAPPTPTQGEASFTLESASGARATTQASEGRAVGSVSPEVDQLLGGLQRGELTVDQYIDGHVDLAAAPYRASLEPERF